MKINVPEKITYINKHYLPIWSRLPEEIVFMCETYAYIRWEQEIDVADLMELAKDCQQDYSEKIQKLSESELKKLFMIS